MATLNFGAKKLYKFSFLNSGCTKRISLGLGVATGIYLTFNGPNAVVATCTPLPGLFNDTKKDTTHDVEADTDDNNSNNNNNTDNNLKPIKNTKGNSNSDHNHDAMDYLIDLYGPSIISMGSGGAIGFCVGYATKTLGKMVAFIAGVGFIGVQAASYYGYIEVDWLGVQKGVTDMIDINGDGKIDKEDLHLWWHGFKDFITHALPSSSGFTAGFIMGMRS